MNSCVPVARRCYPVARRLSRLPSILFDQAKPSSSGFFVERAQAPFPQSFTLGTKPNLASARRNMAWNLPVL